MRGCELTDEPRQRTVPITRAIAFPALFAMPACETVEGAGRDLETAGEVITDEAQDTQSCNLSLSGRHRKPIINARLTPRNTRITPMRTTAWRALAALITIASLSACAPLLIGGGAAIVADEAIEQDQGGDGLF